MTSPLDALQRRLREVVQQLPAALVDYCALGLADSETWAAGGRPIVEVVAPHASLWNELLRTARAVDWCSPSMLSGMLRGASVVERAWLEEQSVEIAWTGPTPPLSSLRRTEQALLEVIRSARRELWLVSFAAYHVQSVADALVESSRAGCKVRLLLESPEESSGKLTSGGAQSVPAAVRQSCELLVWPREQRPTDERGRTGLLHAKCAVADGERLYVGSANLTEHAFELNIELGVVIRSTAKAAQVAAQLNWLHASGRLQRPFR